jgi:hypothetical protein
MLEPTRMDAKQARFAGPRGTGPFAALGFRARDLVLLAVLLAATAAVLAAMGRPWWCRAGDYAVWSGDVWSRHNSQHLVDPYTITHVLHGIALYGLLWALLRGRVGPRGRAALAIAVETAWEIIENTDAMIERYRTATISLDYYGDSVANSLGDIIGFVFGYLGAGVMPVWLSLLGFVAVDGLLVLWIRDSLLLNVLMLVHPIEAVKAWQMSGMP